ncbi:MAG: acetolactate synthase large subunit, partial [Bacteroidetes bacterium]|nr:acetolactate synthase large subunit [Bacteroidota bacterium]
ANRKAVCESLSAFVKKFSFPFFTTQMGKGVVDERNPDYMGTAAISGHDFLHCAIEKADLIINVGHDVVEKPPFLMNKNAAKVIHLNFFPARVDEVYFPQLNVVGDIATSIKLLTEKIQNTKNWDFSYFEKVRKETEKQVAEYSEDDRFPVLPQRLVSIARGILPDDGIIAVDNGIYKLWFAREYKCYQPNTLIIDNALASMGAGLPAAMAAKILNPDKKVVAICGDGGFLMNSQELETAQRIGLDLVVIVLNDSAYGMIKWKQEDMGMKNFGLGFGNPDFVKYAESYGAKGYRPESCEEFEQVFEKTLQSKGIHLIDLKVDYSLNHEILNVYLKEKTCDFDEV